MTCIEISRSALRSEATSRTSRAKTTTSTNHSTGMLTAFNTLGIPSWHFVKMAENTPDMAMWIEVLESKFHPEKADRLPLNRQTFDNLLGQYGACTDQPAAIVAAELVAAYPEAKVVLVERDVDKWFESFRNTVIAATNEPAIPFVARIDRDCTGAMARISDLITKHYFHVTAKRENWLFNNPAHFEQWRQNAKAAYLAHNAEVKRVTPPERLLLFRLDEGWEPLCKFLGKPVPDVPFPKVNDTEAVKELVSLFIMEGLRIGLLDITRRYMPFVVLLLSVGIWYKWR
jgi:hypothetical protein